MLCCRNVTCCTESEPADRLQDETRRSTGQEEHRDQQGLRTVRAESMRHHEPNNGKASNVTSDQYTGCPKGRLTEILLNVSYILLPDFIYLSRTHAPLWTRYPLFLLISVAADSSQ